eukprot:2283314-Ditylum_brightwellii.AAC.1
MEKSQNATNPSINSASATTPIAPNTYTLSASATFPLYANAQSAFCQELHREAALQGYVKG